MASRGVNRVTLIGNLGADPERRSTNSGSTVTTLSVATSESWKDKQTGEQQERTEWHRVKMFGKLADIAAEYLTKGRQVYIEGSIRTDKYTDKQNVERYSTEIVASEMQMLGAGEGGQRSANGNSTRSQATQSVPQQHTQAAPRQHAPPQNDGFAPDDVPF